MAKISDMRTVVKIVLKNKDKYLLNLSQRINLFEV